MPVFPLAARSSRAARALTKALTSFVNAYDLSAEKDMVVHAFQPTDVPNWADLPAIWHRPNGVDIVINLGKLAEAMTASSAPGTYLGRRIPEATSRVGSADPAIVSTSIDGVATLMLNAPALERTARTISSVFPTADASRRPFRSFRDGGYVDMDNWMNAHRSIYSIGWRYHPTQPEVLAANILVGAVIREAAYNVFAAKQVRKSQWFAGATGYQRNIITVLDELRVERQAIARLSGLSPATSSIRDYVRAATAITMPVNQIIQDMMTPVESNGEQGASLAGIALNSALILGRTKSDVLLDYEVADMRTVVGSIVGMDTVDAMYEIIDEYTSIVDADADGIMPLVHRWEELFKSEDDGQNAKSSAAPSPSSDGESDEGEGGGSGEGDADDDSPADAGGSGDQGDEESDGAEGDNTEGESDGSDQNGEGESADGKGKSDDSDDSDDSEAGERSAKSVRQQRQRTNLQNKHGDAGQGTRGATATSFGGTNTTRKNSDADPGKDAILPSTGLLKELAEKANEIHGEVERNTEYREHTHRATDRTPSRRSFEEAEHREQPKADIDRLISRGRILKPSPLDVSLARELGRALADLNIYDRQKTKVADVLPPGRLRTRAAVQRSAERAMNRPPVSRPWERVKRTVDTNPPLTVGIMTDTSGSMGWAEKLVAEFAWIVQHAVSTVNGRAAALSFGNGATVTLRPGERMKYAQVVAADGGGEEFDMGMGTLDVMLNLVKGTGTRIVFVFTDGNFVFSNMMRKRDAWLEDLRRAGVHVVWVTPEPTSHRRIDGIPVLPASQHATLVSAEGVYRSYSEEERTQSKRELIRDLGKRIQQGVRAAKARR